MENSIALPIATLAHTVDAPPRCFVVFPQGYREVAAFPFQLSVIEKLREAYLWMRAEGEWSGQWFTTLFFPESWPPALIDDFLHSYAWQQSLLD